MVVLPEPCKFIDGKPEDEYVKLRARPNRGRYLHIVEWERVHGPVPEGLKIDHLCSNKACYEITHLDPVTQSENVRRSYARGERPPRTHCRNGHSLEGDGNFRMQHDSYKVCRPCQQAANRRYRMSHA